MMKKLFLRIYLTLIVIVIPAQGVFADGYWRKLKNWVDSSDIKGCDTTYVRLPKEGFVAYLMSSPSGASTHFEEKHPEGNIDMSLHSRLTNMWALRLAYRGWGLSYSKTFDNSDDSEFSFSSYGKRYGIEFRIHSSHNLNGSFSDNSDAPTFSGNFVGDSSLKSWLINFYWAFNTKRFSMPAAMTHTTIQLRSAGSWLACLNYVYTKFNIVPNAEVIPDYMVGVSFKQVNLGGGYAYNYIFGREHCLLHVSAMPMVSIWHHNRFKDSDGEIYTIDQQPISLSAIAHLSFVYNISRYVAGMSSIYNLSRINSSSEDMSIYVNDLSATLFFGVRF